LEEIRERTEQGHSTASEEILALIDLIEEMLIEYQEHVINKLSEESVPKNGEEMFRLYVDLDKAIKIVKEENQQQ
jgi:hypothetical protein